MKKFNFLMGGLLLIVYSLANASTLTQAIQQTMQTNPDVLVKMKTWQAAQKAVRRAQGAYLPSLDLVGELGIKEYNDTLQPGSQTLTPAGIGLAIQQMLFDGFATPSEVERNEKLSLSEQYIVQAVSNDTALLATNAYLEVMRSKKIVALAQRNYQTISRIYYMIKNKAQSPLARKANMSQAFARLSSAKADLLATQNSYRDALATYIKVVGDIPKNLVLPQNPKPNDLPLSKITAIKDAINNHPSLKAAQANIAETQAQHRAAKASNFPHLYGVLSTDIGHDTDIVRSQGHYEDYRATLELKYNLYHGGADKAYQEQTGLQIQAAQQAMHQTYDQVVQNMDIGWNGLITASNQLQYFKNHRNAITTTVKAYYEQFKLGKRSLVDLLNAENELFHANIAYLSGQYSLLYAKYRILNANGRLLNYLRIPYPTTPQLQPKITITTSTPTYTTQPVTQPPVITPQGITTKPVTAAPGDYNVTTKHIAPTINKEYTLQLYNSYDKNAAVNFIVANNLQSKAAFYKTTFLNKDKYVVVYGAYKSPAEALEAIKALTPAVQKWNPTIKPLATIQQEMQS